MWLTTPPIRFCPGAEHCRSQVCSGAPAPAKAGSVSKGTKTSEIEAGGLNTACFPAQTPPPLKSPAREWSRRRDRALEIPLPAPAPSRQLHPKHCRCATNRQDCPGNNFSTATRFCERSRPQLLIKSARRGCQDYVVLSRVHLKQVLCTPPHAPRSTNSC